MRLFRLWYELPASTLARLAAVPATIAVADALLLAWSQSATVGFWVSAVIVALVAVTGAAAALRRANDRLDTILREELDAGSADRDPATRNRRP
ncbi:hypothetical protein [Amycolatopsis sp. cmx-4-61]|uniref:hypothetical protein n=1 Tax=Amycolatopsis sp. cmx-4-61 TaxID=2790937 RepID=UPI00397BDCEF